jgi:hypothetical protein
MHAEFRWGSERSGGAKSQKVPTPPASRDQRPSRPGPLPRARGRHSGNFVASFVASFVETFAPEIWTRDSRLATNACGFAASGPATRGIGLRERRRERITSREFSQSSTVLVAAIVNRSWSRQEQESGVRGQGSGVRSQGSGVKESPLRPLVESRESKIRNPEIPPRRRYRAGIRYCPPKRKVYEQTQNGHGAEVAVSLFLSVKFLRDLLEQIGFALHS